MNTLTIDGVEHKINDDVADLVLLISKERDELKGEMSASEALFGFMGWLTSRQEVTPELSAKHDASIAAQLIEQFCNENKLTPTRDGWENNLIHPSGECSG